MKVLICEENAVIALDLCWLLHEQGHTVCAVVKNTTACLEKVAECRPDLVMVDDDLQDGLTGLSLVETLAMLGFPAMIISGEPQSVARTTSARAVLSKPFNDAHLASTMARVEQGSRPQASVG